MEIQRVVSEDPVRTQWQLISRYAYSPNVQRYRSDKGLAAVSQEVSDSITGCFRQAEAYFTSAATAPLDISPLLLYYGTVNLLAGGWGLIQGKMPDIKNHGMRLEKAIVNVRIGERIVTPINPVNGALHIFSQVFADGCIIPSGSAWPLMEILGSIPDIRRDFLLCYSGKPVFTVPIEQVRTPDLTFDRFPVSDLINFPTKDEKSVSQIPGYSPAYLPPHNTGDFVILYRKPRGKEIGLRALSGEKYLELPHLKGGQKLCPGQLMPALMALYAIATLSRYSPEVWHPFVRSDSTGERHVVEQLINVSKRYIPNLVLNQIEGTEIQFVFSSHGLMDMPVPMSRKEVEAVAQEVVNKTMRNGGITL